MYMLDTNILIYAMRHPKDKLVQKLIDHACGDICISTITLAELELGILRSSNPLKNRQSLMAVLSGIDVLLFDITPAIKHCHCGHWYHQVLDKVRESGDQSMTGRASGFVTVMS